MVTLILVFACAFASCFAAVGLIASAASVDVNSPATPPQAGGDIAV